MSGLVSLKFKNRPKGYGNMIFFLMLPFFATAQYSAEERRLYSSLDWGPAFHSKSITEHRVSLELKNNEVDISPVIKIIDQLRESDYANDLNMMEIIINKLSAPEQVFDFLCEQSASKNNCMETAKKKLESAFYKVVQEKENQILYPEGYNNIYGYSQAENNGMFKIANKILDSECLSDYDETKLSTIMQMLPPSNRLDELQDKLKYKDKKFLNKLLQGVYTQLKTERYPKQCFDPANKNHEVCKTMQKALTVKVQRVKYLIKLVYGQDTLSATEASAPCLDCMEGSLPKELSDLNHLFSLLKEQSLCSDPVPGKEKQVTNHPYSYTVRREQDGSFSIPLNLTFTADEDYDGEIPKDQVPAQYKKKVRECLKKANSKMLGPNGEKLKIVLEDPPNKKQDPCQEQSAEQIKIGSREHRSNAGKYKSDIDCPTIVHEVLHLTGLCDEYKETARGFYVSADTGEIKKASIWDKPDNKKDTYVPSYDCRVTSTNSIMSNQYERWNYVFEESGPVPEEQKESSLLNPAQFNAVLYGGCPSKNKLFNECADLAYQTSVHKESKDCLKQKRKCMENNVLEQDKQKELSKIRKDIKFYEELREYMLKFLQTEIIDKNKPESKISEYKDKIQERADLPLQTLRERLEIVSAWPD